MERQSQVEDFAGVDLPVPHQIDQIGQEAAHRCGPTVEMDVGKEQLLAVEFDPVRDADIADGPTRPCGTDRLHHRLLRADTFQHRISTDSMSQLLDTCYALLTALGHDVGRAELAGEFLPRLMTAHRDDPFCPHPPGGEHSEETDRAVTDDRDRRAWLHVRCVGGKPTGAHDIGKRQQARDQVFRRNLGGGHQGTVRKRDAEHTCLRSADKLAVLTGRLVASMTVGTGVIGGEERTDDELARLDRGDGAADLLNNAAVLVPHWGGLENRVDSAVWPQVRAAHACGRDPNDYIGRLDNLRRFTLLETQVSRSVKNCSSHGFPRLLQRMMKPPATEIDWPVM